MSILSYFRDRKNKKAIVSALSDQRFEFRTIATIAAIVGGNGAYADVLVNSLPTRRAYGKGQLVGLTSRVGVAPRKRADISRQAVAHCCSPAPVAVAVPSNREKLVALLSNPKYRFRSYNAMIDATHLGTAKLDELLTDIGARRAVKNGHTVYDSWGLVSRVGAAPGSRATAAPAVENPLKAKLIALLSVEGYEYRKYDTLLSKLGCPADELDDLLLAVEARPMVKDGSDTDLYGLVSRVGKGPNADEDEDEDEEEVYSDEDEEESDFDEDDFRDE